MIIQNSSDIKVDYFTDKNGDILPTDVLYEKHIINPDGLIQLQKLPSTYTVFAITGKDGVNTVAYNKANIITDPNEFTVDYENGVLMFHTSKINSPIQVSYTNAIGQILISADRIFTKIDNTGKATERLSKILDDSRIALDGIKTMGDAANIIRQTQSNIDLIKNLTNDIVVAGTLNKELNVNGKTGKSTNDTLNTAIGNATSKLTELEQWIKEHQDIVDIDTRLENVVNKINTINKFNILDFGAVGDGITDNTKAFIKAFNEIPNDSTLVIPNGEYIVYKDLEGKVQGDSILLSECILLKNKKNITIIGEGNVLIRPNNQGTAEVKKRYPCTLSIDECTNINIKNINVESKGEDYGDADAGHSVAQGTLRTNFVIQNGGSAILITRSKDIIIDNVISRFCGSCAVIYHSNVSDCIVKNTFANPASLGYAGFTMDTFCTNESTFNNKIKYINCNSWAETIVRDSKTIGQTLYASKCGILVEGDERVADCEIYNCILKNCYANSQDLYLGGGVITTNAKTVVNNCIFDDCANMVYKGDTLTNQGSLTVNNCNGKNLRTNGIVIRDLYSLSGLKDIIISNNIIEVNGMVIHPTNESLYLREASGICNAEYRNKSNIYVNNNTIISKSNGIYQVANGYFELNNNTILTEGYDVNVNGGGSIDLYQNKFKRNNLSDDGKCNVYINTTGKDGSVGVFEISINSNEFTGINKSHQALQVVTDNVESLIKAKSVLNNTFNNCCVNIDKTNYKPIIQEKRVRLISSTTLAGSYTVFKFDFSNGIGTTENFKIIANDGTVLELLKQGREIVDNQYLEIFYVLTDVREKVTQGNYYTLL